MMTHHSTKDPTAQTRRRAEEERDYASIGLTRMDSQLR